MKIIIATGAMAFGPETPHLRSLGGSETAALMLGKALAARGHEVTHFCNLPSPPAPDAHESGKLGADGVRYVAMQNYQNFVTTNEHDLLIATRDPNLVALPALAKKRVLWMHDIATKRGMQRALAGMEFTVDELWTVSEWHRHQVSETTGYPLNKIVALRNGIVKHAELPPAMPRISNQILYAARPERGLDNLIAPGGVMDQLPEYRLLVAFYAHFPEHMREYYEGLFARMKQMPNVEFIGPKSNLELRQIIAESAAYIYPTQFEETSCILARECIEQQTPFFTTSVGALPETLGECGIFFEEWLHFHGYNEPERGSLGWKKLFASFFREAMKEGNYIAHKQALMAARDDLYWDGVAETVEQNSTIPQAKLFSRIYSLLQDGDAIPAMYLAQHTLDTLDDINIYSSSALKQITKEFDNYAFIKGDIGEYYDALYREKSGGPETELHFVTQGGGPRFEAITEEIAQLPPGSTVFEYGCGPGHIIGPLATMFPLLHFVGYDFSSAAVEVVNDGARDHGLNNLHAYSTEIGHDIGQYDAVICSEVLEHVVKPWELAAQVEAFVRPGGRVIFTTPFGPWEPISYERQGHWKERFHLWQIDRQMMVEMLPGKQNQRAILMVCGTGEDLRQIGNLLFSYTADHAPTVAVDPIAKALRHRSRQTCAAAVIAMNNEDTIIRLLNSLEKKVQFVKIALGPSTDRTRELVDGWMTERPWMRYEIVDAPKIEPYKFGFDDARNLSLEGLERDFEWVLWIDTDEWLSGDFRKYLTNSALDGYLVPQHHFTCVPRGAPTEIDRPARLLRTSAKHKAIGHIHEHLEIPEGGPGRCFQLPDVDIGHGGYVNEDVRKGRFFRNFPFLEWDHNENPNGRKLHHFLWLRDMIHRMRFMDNMHAKVQMAQAAVDYYNEHQEAMATFGPGIFMAVAYISEAYALLGRGVPVKVSVQLEEGQAATIQGTFESYAQLEKVFAQLLGDEFKERTSRYW